MGLNIKNLEVERLVSEVANLTRETKTEAIRKSLVERKMRLQARSGGGARVGIRSYLERFIWPSIPPEELGRVISSAEEDQILGYGPEGY